LIQKSGKIIRHGKVKYSTPAMGEGILRLQSTNGLLQKDLQSKKMILLLKLRQTKLIPRFLPPSEGVIVSIVAREGTVVK